MGELLDFLRLARFSETPCYVVTCIHQSSFRCDIQTNGTSYVQLYSEHSIYISVYIKWIRSFLAIREPYFTYIKVTEDTQIAAIKSIY